MKRLVLKTTLLALTAVPAIWAQPPAGGADPHRAMLATYCQTCHNSRLKTGGIAFDSMNLQNAPDDAAVTAAVRAEVLALTNRFPLYPGSFVEREEG